MAVLLRHLPPGNAVAQALHGKEAPWSIEQQLLAHIYDQIALGNWHYVAAHSKRKTPPPERLPRPGVTPRVSTTRIGHTTRTRDEVKAFLARYKPVRKEGD